MKRLLSVLVVLTLSLGCLGGCGNNSASSGINMNAAKGYFDAIFKSTTPESMLPTTTSYIRPSLVKGNGEYFNVTWSLEVTEGDPAAVTLSEVDETTKLYTVSIGKKLAADVKYTLTATISDAEGNSIVQPYYYYAPMAKANTYSEYVNAEKGDLLTVQGTVTAVLSVSNGAGSNSLYLEDSDGAYYAYGAKAITPDPLELGIRPGMKVEVTGAYELYNGSRELISPSTGVPYEVTILDETINPFTPADYTELFLSATALNDEALTANQGGLITLKGVELTGSKDTYYYFKLGDKSTYLRIYQTACPLNSNEITYLQKTYEEHIGYTADVTGLLTIYNENMYLTPVSDEAFTNFQLPELSETEKIAFEFSRLSYDTIDKETTLTLPSTGKLYSEVELSWSLAEENPAATLTGNKLTVTPLEEETSLTLVVAATCGSEKSTYTIELAVDAAATEEYFAELEAPVVGEKYALQINQVNLNEVLYFTGAQSGDYLATTNKLEKAALLTVEAADNGYKLYFTAEDGTKKYLDFGLNAKEKVVASLSETGAVFTWNDEAKTFFGEYNGATYYFGTYNSYNTISVSSISYITDANAANVDIKQFPARPVKVYHGAKVVSIVEEPVDGTSYVLNVSQKNRAEELYFAGTISGDYLQTTTKLDKAVMVTVEAVEGGYKLYFIAEDGTKTYFDFTINSKSKVVAALTTTGAVFKWNAEAKTFIGEYEGSEYYYGTYNTYNTISVSSTSYITGDNAVNVDVKQFPSRLGLPDVKKLDVVEVPVAGSTYKLQVNQKNADQELFFAGAASGDYLASTNKLSKAADVTVEAVDGGYRLFFYSEDGTKTYLDFTLNSKEKVVAHLTTEPTTVFTWNADAKTFVGSFNGGEYYLGCYSKYTTISASSTSYITGDNAKNVDYSQFPVRLFGVN